MPGIETDKSIRGPIMEKEKKESKTRIGEKVKLPSGYWEIIKETLEGVVLTNRKGHRQAFTLEQLAQFEKTKNK